MPNFEALAVLSSQAYNPSEDNGYKNVYTGVEYTSISYDANANIFDDVLSLGFEAQSFHSFQGNEDKVVIAFAGTEPELWSVDGLIDRVSDLKLALHGETFQDTQALKFAKAQVKAAKDKYGEDVSIEFTGHSLGGFLAQLVVQEIGEGSATVFNAPGMGGGIHGTDLVNDNVTYVYSNPFEWDTRLTRAIHKLGDIVSDNVYFVHDADGHSIGAITAAYGRGSPSFSADQWGAILAENMRTGEISIEDLKLFFGLGDIISQTVLQSMRDSGVRWECFGSGTSIDMWPLDLSLKQSVDGVYDQKLALVGIWSKPIEEIAVGDLVVAFDENGKLVPGKVPRTMSNHVKILLNFFGTRVTPGHVYFRPDSEKTYKFETLIDVLRDDGVIQKQDGNLIRATTNVPVGDPRDGFVKAIVGTRKADGSVDVRDQGRIRLGTRFVINDGDKRTTWCVADLIEAGGGSVGEDELIRVGGGEPMSFHWEFGDMLPKPEDFVLACSGTTLEDIYKAAEWEGQHPHMPAPMVMDGGPVQPLSHRARSAMARNEPLSFEPAAPNRREL
jgi:hypothetical protein